MLDGNALLSAEELAVGPRDDFTLHYWGSVGIQLQSDSESVEKIPQSKTVNSKQ